MAPTLSGLPIRQVIKALRRPACQFGTTSVFYIKRQVKSPLRTPFRSFRMRMSSKASSETHHRPEFVSKGPQKLDIWFELVVSAIFGLTLGTIFNLYNREKANDLDSNGSISASRSEPS